VWHAADAGVLSTTSLAVEGYPFGSVTPFVTTPEGRAVILVSSLAQHTKNMQADPRVCLTALEGKPGDKQAQARVSLLGDASPVPDEALPRVQELYLTAFPNSRGHFQAHDFSFWWIEPRRVRYIAGFGDIHWIEPEAWTQAGPPT
jgi:putative heme iron utilization protein